MVASMRAWFFSDTDYPEIAGVNLRYLSRQQQVKARPPAAAARSTNPALSLETSMGLIDNCPLTGP
jgi:hypothetical protein